MLSTLLTLFIFLMILFILSSLGAGLYYLVKDRGKSDKTVKALTFRIVLSILLFIILFVLFALGVISPHGLLH